MTGKGWRLGVSLAWVEAEARAAEAEFHALVFDLVRQAKGRGEAPDQVRKRLVKHFLDEPTLRQADMHEQERVVVGLQRAIEEALECPAPH